MSVEEDLAVCRKYISLRDSAAKRGKEFNLSLTSLRNMQRAKKCFFTGRPLTKSNRSIDRVDPSQGYITGNVVACDRSVNAFKDNLTPEEIIKIAEKLKKRSAE